MLQPDRLQPGIAPLKVKKMPSIHFKTAWKFPETSGKSRQKAEKTGSLRKFPERVGKIRTFSNSGPEGRGFESRHFDMKTRDAPCGYPGFLLSGLMGEEPAAATANEESVSPVGSAEGKRSEFVSAKGRTEPAPRVPGDH